MNKVYIHISHSLYKTCGVNCYTKWNNEIHISHSLYKTACGELDVMEFMGFTYHIVYIKLNLECDLRPLNYNSHIT